VIKRGEGSRKCEGVSLNPIRQSVSTFIIIAFLSFLADLELLI
jgi:hypothetical protein